MLGLAQYHDYKSTVHVANPQDRFNIIDQAVDLITQRRSIRVIKLPEKSSGTTMYRSWSEQLFLLSFAVTESHIDNKHFQFQHKT